MNNQKKTGVWMDSQHAVIVGAGEKDPGTMEVLAHVKASGSSSNSSEKTANNEEKMLQAKFFKEITTHLVNATHIHVTGTGQAQEKFIHYLAETPQFKNTATSESTSNKMNDEQTVTFIAGKLG